MDRRSQVKTKKSLPIQQLNRYPTAKLTAWLATTGGWLLVLIATPVGLWTIAGEIFPFLVSLGVLAQLGATVSALSLTWTTKRIVVTIGIVCLITWSIELLGVARGFPFGKYSYTGELQPQVGGVPLLIPFAWMMMLAPAWGATYALLGKAQTRLGRGYWIVFAAIAGAAFTAWDLYLDPQMVARGMWVWENPGSVNYFGIPWLNYLGWWLASALLTLIIRPDDLPYVPLLIMYTFTWAFQAIGQAFFWGQPGPAFAGFLAMGTFTILAWLKARQAG